MFRSVLIKIPVDKSMDYYFYSTNLHYSIDLFLLKPWKTFETNQNFLKTDFFFNLQNTQNKKLIWESSTFLEILDEQPS